MLLLTDDTRDSLAPRTEGIHRRWCWGRPSVQNELVGRLYILSMRSCAIEVLFCDDEITERDAAGVMLVAKGKKAGVISVIWIGSEPFGNEGECAPGDQNYERAHFDFGDHFLITQSYQRCIECNIECRNFYSSFIQGLPEPLCICYSDGPNESCLGNIYKRTARSWEMVRSPDLICLTF